MILRLCVPAIWLRIIRTGKGVMLAVLDLLLEPFLLVLLPVMSVYEVTACNDFEAAEDHDVTYIEWNTATTAR